MFISGVPARFWARKGEGTGQSVEKLFQKNLFSLDFMSNCIHNVYVRIIGKLKLQSFWQSHQQARKPLEKWIQIVEEAEWRNWSQLKSTFRKADLIQTKTNTYVIFDMGGNKYRLVTIVNFRGQVVIVEVALTHRQYDKGKWKG